MAPKLVSTIVKLTVISLLLGIVISFFDVSPRRILELLGTTVQDIMATLLSIFEWAFSYILVGAVVVVPIWLIVVAWRTVRGKTGSRN